MMGVCELDRDCIGCHAFYEEAKGRGTCRLYGRGKYYEQYNKICFCKNCLIKVMCSKACIPALDIYFDSCRKEEIDDEIQNMRKWKS